jgi:ABC-type iron transport system FetAB ATPase subunit
VLRVEKLKVHGLPPLSFSVPAGECLVIEGPSGCGKTMLLRAIADLDPTPGYVFLEGAERAEMSATRWRRRVGYVAAEPGWWAETAGAHMPKSDKTSRLVTAVGLSMPMLDQPLSELSTGERQRLALVRTVLGEPRALLLDEPTASLDQASAAMVEELVKFQMLGGRPVLLVSHDARQIERLSHARLLLGTKPYNGIARGTAA